MGANLVSLNADWKVYYLICLSIGPDVKVPMQPLKSPFEWNVTNIGASKISN